MTEPGTPPSSSHERPRDRVTERLDALERQAREQLAQIDALRADLDVLSESQAEDRAVVGRLDARLGSMEGKVDEVARRQGAHEGMLSRLSAQVGRGTVVGAGVPTAAVVAVELLRALGVLPS